MNFEKDIEKLLGISLSLEQMDQFNVYYEFLVEYNKITNLTRITEKEEVFYKDVLT
jgi:16S rRNA (guanine527-N7)-methyltransferase